MIKEHKYSKNNKKEAEVDQSNVQEGHTNEEAPALDEERDPTPASRLRDCYPEP
jgi:hypothetical protein